MIIKIDGLNYTIDLFLKHLKISLLRIFSMIIGQLLPLRMPRREIIVQLSLWLFDGGLHDIKMQYFREITLIMDWK